MAMDAAKQNDAQHPAMGTETYTKKKIVLEIDLVGYADTSRLLEQIIGPIGVQLLQEQIQNLVDRSLKVIGLTRKETFMQSAGDNAILGFDCAEDAHYFAQAVSTINQAQNNNKTLLSARQQFRMGVATGEIVMQANDIESACGIVITNAVRLESATAPGEILIDSATYAALPPKLQKLYGSEETILGKRSEVFQAHRYNLNAITRPVPTKKQTQHETGWSRWLLGCKRQ